MRFFLMLLPNLAFGAPFIVSDPYVLDPKPIYCSVAYDGSLSVTNWTVAMDQEGNPYCKIDLAGVSFGSHTASVSACLDNGDCSGSSVLQFSLAKQRRGKK